MKSSRIVVITLIFCLLIASFSVNAENSAVSESSKIFIFENLNNALATLENEDIIQIYVWLTDIQSDQIKHEIEKELFGEMSIDDASLEEMNEYVKRCRERLSSEYEISNANKIKSIEKACGDIDVVFSSCYAPMCIIQLSKEQFDIVLSLKEDVVAVDLFEDLQATIESDVANYNSGAAYVRDSLGYTGDGIKIGMIELGNPLALTEYNSYFNTNKIHVLGTYTNTTYEENVHATRVAAIMVGKGTTYNNVTYKGIVPNADLYCIQCFDVSSFFSGVQTLLNQGVNVINMSMGFGPQASYTMFNLWVDHIAYTEDVHVVKSAGNMNNSNPNYKITIPGLSYNIVTVGAYCDSNDTFDCSGPSTIGQQLLNPSSFNIADFSCFFEDVTSICKPDLVAAGVNIQYAGLPNSYAESSGTSFAAPQVTAVMAQLVCKCNI